ncbi:MAG TPA: hypothetical protein VFX12_13225 [Vicinamibacterales bacterium]|nr:hypothetical protein [Vicinamibacterales bacterium]
MIAVSAFRFFRIVSPHAAYVRPALAAVLAIALCMVWLNPADVDSALGCVLLVQMFAASTAFLPDARRGRFDPALIRGHSRTRVLAAHWVVSIAPGVVSWVVVCSVAIALGGQAALSGLFGWRMLGLVMVSVVAWSAGTRVPRGFAGVLWVSILMLLLMRREQALAFVLAGPSPGVGGVLEQAAMVWLCPFLLLGGPGHIARIAVAIAAFATVLAGWAAVRSLAVCDVLLVDESS